MSVNIFYNSVDFFSSKDIPTPKVRRSSATVEMGEITGVRELLVLEGSIYIESPPTNCDYFSEITKIRDELFNFFSQKYKPLTMPLATSTGLPFGSPINSQSMVGPPVGLKLIFKDTNLLHKLSKFLFTQLITLNNHNILLSGL